MKHQKPIKNEKLSSVANLSASLKAAKSIVFVDYTGMDMKTQQGLMNKLKEVKGQMVVAKNTLIKIAGKEANLPEELLTDSVLSGQTAIIVSKEDAFEPLQLVGKFMETSEKPKWKAGTVEGIYQDAQSLSKISKLPGKNQLIANVIGSMSSPLYGLVGTLNGNIQKLVYILSQKAAQG